MNDDTGELRVDRTYSLFSPGSGETLLEIGSVSLHDNGTREPCLVTVKAPHGVAILDEASTRELIKTLLQCLPSNQ